MARKQEKKLMGFGPWEWPSHPHRKTLNFFFYGFWSLGLTWGPINGGTRILVRVARFLFLFFDKGKKKVKVNKNLIKIIKKI
jgi:hypothetical protein